MVGLDFLPLFKTRFVEEAFRGSLIGGTEGGPPWNGCATPRCKLPILLGQTSARHMLH